MDPLSVLLAGAAGAGLASLITRGREDRRAPQGLADLLNWAFLVDDGVVLLKDGALMAAFRYRGPDLASATAPELGSLSSAINDALLPFGDGWMLHVDAIRSPAPPYRSGDFPNAVTGWIDEERRQAFRSSRPQFVSEYTLALSFVPPREVYARAASVFLQRGDGVRGGGAGEGTGATGAPAVDWAAVLSGYLGALDALARRLQSRLQIERLGSDALVSHLHRCLTGLPHAVSAPPYGSYLNTVLASQELVGGFAPRIGDRHLRVVAVVGYPDASTPGRLDFLNALPMAYRWSSRWVALSPHTTDRLIKRHQQRWFMGRKGMGAFLRDVTGAGDPLSAARREQQNEALFHDGDASRMAHDAAAAAAANASGVVRFGYATQVLVLSDDDPARVDAAAASAVAALQERGFPARVETVNALDALFGSLPGHGAQNLRRPILSTRNTADLWPVTSVWPGLTENPSPYFPPRTPALMHVATEGSTPFRLNLHVGDVGHTLLVGATGAGKSTFVGLTVAQWQRYAALGARTFVFDVGYSHWLLARACGARHHDIGVGDAPGSAPSRFQPLADVDRPEERAWAAGWLESLLELQGVAVTPQQRARLDHALVLLGAEPRQYRTLTELTVQLQDPALVAALRPYTIAGPYGRLLDASDDALATGTSHSAHGQPRHQVFELRQLMDVDDKVLVPVLLYLFRHVERQLDGSPTLIVIEELWAPLMRTVFANRIKQWLLTLRKQNAAVVLVAHTPAQLEAVPGKQVLVESCPTRVLLPNPDAANPATARLYAELGLNEREIAVIASAQPKRDYYVRGLGATGVRLRGPGRGRLPQRLLHGAGERSAAPRPRALAPRGGHWRAAGADECPRCERRPRTDDVEGELDGDHLPARRNRATEAHGVGGLLRDPSRAAVHRRPDRRQPARTVRHRDQLDADRRGRGPRGAERAERPGGRGRADRDADSTPTHRRTDPVTWAPIRQPHEVREPTAVVRRAYHNAPACVAALALVAVAFHPLGAQTGRRASGRVLPTPTGAVQQASQRGTVRDAVPESLRVPSDAVGVALREYQAGGEARVLTGALPVRPRTGRPRVHRAPRVRRGARAGRDDRRRAARRRSGAVDHPDGAHGPERRNSARGGEAHAVRHLDEPRRAHRPARVRRAARVASVRRARRRCLRPADRAARPLLLSGRPAERPLEWSGSGW